MKRFSRYSRGWFRVKRADMTEAYRIRQKRKQAFRLKQHRGFWLTNTCEWQKYWILWNIQRLLTNGLKQYSTYIPNKQLADKYKETRLKNPTQIVNDYRVPKNCGYSQYNIPQHAFWRERQQLINYYCILYIIYYCSNVQSKHLY